MTRIVYLVFGVLVGGAAVFGSLKYHFLRTADGFAVVPKLESSFQDTYVDVRQFGVTDWVGHRALAAALVQAKRENIIQTSTTAKWKELLPQ